VSQPHDPGSPEPSLAPEIRGPVGEGAPPPAPKRRPVDVVWDYVRDYFFGEAPTFWIAMVPALILAAILYTRHPQTNCIFDEQEALLANPYVNGKQGLGWIDAFHRDFWGLPHDRSVGSYRPLPDIVWRLVWTVAKNPWLAHWINVLLHAANGACMVVLAYMLTKRAGYAWLVGAIFTSAAVLTEAVSGVVGIADVMGGLGAIMALISLRLPMGAMPFAVMASIMFGLFSKESALVCVPLVPVAALLLAPATHPEKPMRWLRGALALIASVAAFYVYVEIRKKAFPAPMEATLSDPLPLDASALTKAHRAFMVWFHQPPLPRDPLNNPFVKADTPHRIAGALRVYFRGLVQVVVPHTLSGDYSAPQEPVPTSLYEPETVLGAVFMVVPPLGALAMWIRALFREREWRRDQVFGQRIVSPEERRRGKIQGLVNLVLGLAACAAAAVGLLAMRGGAQPEPWPFAEAAIGIFGVAAGLGQVLGVFGPIHPAHIFGGAIGSLMARKGMLGGVTKEDENPSLPSGQVMVLLSALGMVWVVVSYFPHSNIPVLLPTVRAERFWYFPVIGSSFVIAGFFTWLFAKTRRFQEGAPAVGLFALFFMFQCGKAYQHSRDYHDDLRFWDATRHAVPRSAKAHLNYSVMQGARGRLDIRAESNRVALELAPEWPMAHVYLADTLCRMHKVEEAWPFYKSGFPLAENDPNLLSLGLQCLWDEKLPDETGASVPAFKIYEEELTRIADQRPGTWVAYLVRDVSANGDKNNGVDPKHRPRGYNEGAKD
jgi:hypothetical protein